MIDIRKDLIKSLDKKPTTLTLESCLCMSLNNSDTELFHSNSDKLKRWLEKCIRSLSYEINDTCLILSGNQAVGKTKFLQDLLPEEFIEYYIETLKPKEFVYDYFIINVEGIEVKSKRKETGYWVMDDNFIVRHPFTEKVTTDKRAANYCATTNSSTKCFTRKNMQIIELESIDFELYNSIDKLELWIELYNKYKLVR